MTDALKIISLINDQNIPSNVVEHLFAGEFKADYDSVAISYYDSEGYERTLNYDNVVIKSRIDTELHISAGVFSTQIRIVVESNGRRILEHRLHRPQYVKQFVFIAQAIKKNFEDTNKAKNQKLWDIVDKF